MTAVNNVGHSFADAGLSSSLLSQHTTGAYLLLFLAAGAGGSMSCWRASHDWEAVEVAGSLPPARFRGEPFLDLVALARAGAGRVLGCSSTGAVALWDCERCATSCVTTLP